MDADDTTLINTLETFGNSKKATEIESNLDEVVSDITTYLKSSLIKVIFVMYSSQCKMFSKHKITQNQRMK